MKAMNILVRVIVKVKKLGISIKQNIMKIFKILKDIQKQQSLSKHNIQVSIVKFNQYKVKLRQMRRRYDLFH